MAPSYVVTGGGRGVGRAITERLVHDGSVVVVEIDPSALEWTESVPEVHAVVGSAAELDVAREAARLAEEHGPLAGWVNNAAVFRDADLSDEPETVLDLVRTNLAPAVVGCSVAVAAFVDFEAAGVDRQRVVAPGYSVPCAALSPTPLPRPRSKD